MKPTLLTLLGLFFLGSLQASMEETLSRLGEDLRLCEAHPIMAPLTAAKEPAAAVIIGTGSVGAQAMVLATKALPPGSLIYIQQRAFEDPETLRTFLEQTLSAGKDFEWRVSPSIDLADHEAILSWLVSEKADLAHCVLMIHTADRAQRFIPDALPIAETLEQIHRRSSAALSRDLLETPSSFDSYFFRMLPRSLGVAHPQPRTLSNRKASGR